MSLLGYLPSIIHGSRWKTMPQTRRGSFKVESAYPLGQDQSWKLSPPTKIHWGCPRSRDRKWVSFFVRKWVACPLHSLKLRLTCLQPVAKTCSVSSFIEESVITGFHTFFSFVNVWVWWPMLEIWVLGTQRQVTGHNFVASLSYRVRFLSHKRTNIIMPRYFTIPSETETFIGENTVQRKLLY